MNRAEYLESVSRKTSICRYCGKTYKPKEASRTTYCSRECYFAHKIAKKEERKAIVPDPVYAICPVCKRQFEKKGTNKYCSDGCRKEKERQRYYAKHEHYLTLARIRDAKKAKPKTAFICKECGKVYMPEAGDTRHKYCSIKCGNRYENRVAGNTHRQRARRHGCTYESVNPMRVFMRDGWRCQLCGKKLNPKHRGTIHRYAPELDHIIPLSKGGSHTYQNTQCACRQCNADKGATERGQLRLFG